MLYILNFSKVISSLCVVGFILVTVFSVFMRYFLNSPISWVEEVLFILMMFLVMFGIVCAEADKKHLEINVLIDLFSIKCKRIMGFITLFITSFVLTYYSYISFKLAISVNYKETDILNVSFLWIDLILFFGFFLSLIVVLTKRIGLRG